MIEPDFSCDSLDSHDFPPPGMCFMLAPVRDRAEVRRILGVSNPAGSSHASFRSVVGDDQKRLCVFPPRSRCCPHRLGRGRPAASLLSCDCDRIFPVPFQRCQREVYKSSSHEGGCGGDISGVPSGRSNETGGLSSGISRERQAEAGSKEAQPDLPGLGQISCSVATSRQM